jgi:predicted nucleic acid-binding protein
MTTSASCELADTTAWIVAQRRPHLRAAFEGAVLNGGIAICALVDLELLRGARNAEHLDAMRVAHVMLPQCPTDEGVIDRAREIVAKLPCPRRRRAGVPNLADVLIAAAAECAGLPVLHYDAHFDLIAEVTGQPLRAIAPLGSL